MTDRYNALTVALDHDIRSDDAQALISAIRMLKGVADVTPNVVVNISDHVAEVRAKQELLKRILAVFQE